MKISIAALALSASTSAFAFPMPPSETKTLCLSVYENEDGVSYAGNCDEAANNVELNKPLLVNGCAEGQIALTSRKYGDTFDINIHSCLPPNVVQL